jgi:hypothetical protein
MEMTEVDKIVDGLMDRIYGIAIPDKFEVIYHGKKSCELRYCVPLDTVDFSWNLYNKYEICLNIKVVIHQAMNIAFSEIELGREFFIFTMYDSEGLIRHKQKGRIKDFC